MLFKNGRAAVWKPLGIDSINVISVLSKKRKGKEMKIKKRGNTFYSKKSRAYLSQILCSSWVDKVRRRKEEEKRKKEEVPVGDWVSSAYFGAPKN